MDARVKALPDGERRVTRRADIPTRTDKPSKFGLDTSAMQQLGSLAADESISLLRQKASVNYNDDFYTFFSFLLFLFHFIFRFFPFHPAIFVLRFPFLCFFHVSSYQKHLRSVEWSQFTYLEKKVSDLKSLFRCNHCSWKAKGNMVHLREHLQVHYRHMYEQLAASVDLGRGNCNAGSREKANATAILTSSSAVHSHRMSG